MPKGVESKGFTAEDFQSANSQSDLIEIASEKKIDVTEFIKDQEYNEELKNLQIELNKLQQWVVDNKKKVAIIFEGRDSAGKGGAIKRFTEHLNPRYMRVVALSKPTEIEKAQWYFRRYIKELPNQGEIVFFDRSWYNRAVVEPVMGFCTQEQYKDFMNQVADFEHVLYQNGVELIKFWFAITKDEQKRRFDSRLTDPLKQWKFSPVDIKGQELWDDYSFYRDRMLSKTHTSFSPWHIVFTNNKRVARLESIKHVLSHFVYTNDKDAIRSSLTDPEVLIRYFQPNTKEA